MTRSSGSSAEAARLGGWILRAAASAIVAGSVTPLIASAAGAQEAACPASFAGHSIVGSAAGVQVVEDIRGVTIVEAADGALPAAQAAVDSQFGSIGFAGVPYSGTIAENTGQARSEPNAVPNFAVSSYPAEPNESEKTLPGAHMSTASGPRSSTSQVETGGASADVGEDASESASASARCGTEALEASSENTVKSLAFADVLGIASVHSTASSVLSADGSSKLEASLDVEGATVAGQPVSITKDGVSIVGNVIPLPGNPAADALAEAGVSITYIDARRDEANGEITAPALEIVVTEALPVGSSPSTTTFVIGQAFARATVTGISEPFATPQTLAPVAPVVPITGSVTPPAATGVLPKPAPSSSAPLPEAPGFSTAQIANWSILPAFSALVIGTVLFVASWVVFGRLTARLRWT